MYSQGLLVPDLRQLLPNLKNLLLTLSTESDNNPSDGGEL
jgi:hypothetical protein